MDKAKEKGNDSSGDEMEEIEDEELRAQIKAQLVSATLAACPALIDSVSQRGGKEESDPSNPATAYGGRTALHGAARNGHAAMVGQLLAVNPASIEARTEEGVTVLHGAARGGHAEIVTLAANPALIEVRDNSGETAFHCAAMTHLMTVSPASVEARMNAGGETAQLEGEAKWRNDSSEPMERIDDGDLRAQIKAQLQSEIPLPDGRAALYRAAGSGLRGVVARLLAACPELLDAVEWENGTPLAVAAENGHAAIVAQLLAVKPALAESTSGGCIALHEAARNGHAVIVTQLLAVNSALAEAKSSDSGRYYNGGTALHEAARDGHAAIVAQLLAVNPALIEARTKNGSTVLHCAARGAHVATAPTVSLLLAAKPDLIDARGNDGNTVLHSAVASGNAATVAQVLAAINPALIDVTGGCHGRTAFHDAARRGHAAIVTQLLAANPGLAHSNSSGRAVLDAIKNGHVEIATQLLAANPALIDAKADDGQTVLHRAAMVSGSEALMAKLLAAKPALIEARSNDGQTALHWAACGGRAERVAQLLAAKASVEARANDGRTVLHCAVIGQHSEIVAQLLAAKPTSASIEAKMDNGKTVLHCALGHDEITAQLLAAHPALLDAITNDTDSWTALRNVIQMGHEEAVSRLLAMHPDLIHRTSPDCGWTVFHYAAFYCRDKVMSRLLSSVSQPDLDQLLLRRSTAYNEYHGISQGSTALHMATTDLTGRSSIIITQLLAACPALIDVVDDCNQTCVHYASHESIVELLLEFKPALVHAVDANGNTVLHSMLRGWLKKQCVGREVLQRVWKMNPAALHAVDHDGATPFDVAMTFGNDVAIELLQWSLTFDELMSCEDKHRKNYAARFKSLVKLQCGELNAVLLPGVVDMVFEYVGLGVRGNLPLVQEGLPVGGESTRRVPPCRLQ